MANVRFSRSLIALCALTVALMALPLQQTGATPHKATQKEGSSGYHVAKTIAVGGDESWDYVAIDNDARRIYVSHGSRVMVLDADSGAPDRRNTRYPGRAWYRFCF